MITSGWQGKCFLRVSRPLSAFAMNEFKLYTTEHNYRLFEAAVSGKKIFTMRAIGGPAAGQPCCWPTVGSRLIDLPKTIHIRHADPRKMRMYESGWDPPSNDDLFRVDVYERCHYHVTVLNFVWTYVGYVHPSVPMKDFFSIHPSELYVRRTWLGRDPSGITRKIRNELDHE